MIDKEKLKWVIKNTQRAREEEEFIIYQDMDEFMVETHIKMEKMYSIIHKGEWKND